MTAFTGFIRNLGESNVNYSGGFSGGSASFGPLGLFGAASSGSLSDPGQIKLGGAQVAGFSVGANTTGTLVRRTFNTNATTYSLPFSLGNLKNPLTWLQDPVGSITDVALYAARNACKE